MSDYDEYGDDWGYNGDAEHDMWVDYTTDMYEGSDYSGENPDCDVDWDAEYEANVDYHDGEVQQSAHSSSRPKGHTAAPETVQQYEHGRTITIICAIVSFIAVMIAIFY